MLFGSIITHATQKKWSPECIVSLFDILEVKQSTNRRQHLYVELCALAVELDHTELVYHLNEERIKVGYGYKGERGAWNANSHHSPLHVACHLGNEKLIRYFLEGKCVSSLEARALGYVSKPPTGSTCEYTLDERRSAMEFILYHDNPDLLKICYKYYKQHKHWNKSSILHHCCYTGAFKCAKWCMENRIQSLEAVDECDHTPVMIAFRHEVKWFELFIRHGAKLLRQDERGYWGEIFCYAACMQHGPSPVRDVPPKDMGRNLLKFFKVIGYDRLTREEYGWAFVNFIETLERSPPDEEDLDESWCATMEESFGLLLQQHDEFTVKPFDLVYHFGNLLKQGKDHQDPVKKTRCVKYASFVLKLVAHYVRIVSCSKAEPVLRESSYTKIVEDSHYQSNEYETLLHKELLLDLIRNGKNLEDPEFFNKGYEESMFDAYRELVPFVSQRSVFDECLLELDYKVRSLAVECRLVVVYKVLKGKILEKVDRLRIPSTMKSYLLFEDL